MEQAKRLEIRSICIQIARQIAEQRRAAGVSQRRLEALSEIGFKTISSIELGAQGMRLDQLLALTNALGYDLGSVILDALRLGPATGPRPVSVTPVSLSPGLPGHVPDPKYPDLRCSQERPHSMCNECKGKVSTFLAEGA
jgi:transcriptional regulator with XRE-family HTH domain